MAEVTDKPIELTLGDGSKVTGATYEEALQKLGKMKTDTADALKQEKEARAKLEEEIKGYKASEEERKAEADRQAAIERQKQQRPNGKEPGFNKDEYYRLLNEDPLAANRYVLAHDLGISDPAQVPQRFNAMAGQIAEINQERVAQGFWRQHPEFPQEIGAAKALDKRVSALMGEGHPFNIRTFNMAYEELVSEEAIKPMDLDADKNKNKDDKEKEDRDSKPNPSLSGGGGISADEAEMRKFENMDDKQLEAIAREKGWLR